MKWHTAELDNIERGDINNNSGLGTWITTLSQRLKISTSMAFGLLTDEAYSLEGACYCQPPAQSFRTIIRHGLRCNIIDVANQLLFVYRGLLPELQVFINPLTNTIKVTEFIQALEEKQEIWYDMFTIQPNI